METSRDKYYAQIFDNSPDFYNEYVFEIIKEENNTHFLLEMSTISKKGTFGITWEGRLVNRGDHFAIIIQQETDWVKTHNTKKITYRKPKKDIAQVQIYPEYNKLLLYHRTFPKIIELYKID